MPLTDIVNALLVPLGNNGAILRTKLIPSTPHIRSASAGLHPTFTSSVVKSASACVPPIKSMIAEFGLPLREHPSMRLISILVPHVSVAWGMQMLLRPTHAIHSLRTQWVNRGTIGANASIGNAHRQIQTISTRIFNSQSTFCSCWAILRPMGACMKSPQQIKAPRNHGGLS